MPSPYPKKVRSSANPKHFQAVITKVFDGDGGICRSTSHVYRFRLYGADAPELTQPYGKDARDRLFALTRGQCSCTSFARDRFGRILLQIVNHHAQDVALVLLSEGFAWPTPSAPPHKKEPYHNVTKNARAQKHGLWRDDNPIPPWRWRNRITLSP